MTAARTLPARRAVVVGTGAPTRVDLSQALADIRARHSHDSDQNLAASEAAALWGGPLGPRETQRLELQASWYAEIILAPAPNGCWAMAISYQYGIGGFSSNPSLWSPQVWTSRKAAQDAAFAELQGQFKQLTADRLLTPGQQRLAARMAELIRRAQQASRQMSLF